MNLYIGCDLGTSSMKLILMTKNGEILNTVSEEYPLFFPKPTWSEQNPQDWVDALFRGIPKLADRETLKNVCGIGVSGQMHGLVILDENNTVIRPCILWNDSRTEKEVEYLNVKIGKKRLGELTGNIAFAGFTAPKILWLKNNEPQNYSKIHKAMLPKDYINFVLTGEFSTDYSDASGTLLLDVEHKCWSKEMLHIVGFSESVMPKLYESFEVVSQVSDGVAKRLGLPLGVKVVAGAGDNAGASIGTGIIGDGGCNISLGTSGTVFISSSVFNKDCNCALHSFAHADGGYHLMGCMLSCASANKWLLENILNTNDYDGEFSRIKEENLGENQVYFLPYLMGERSPINDVNARGTFIGMTANTTREDMILAVLEGVAFAIKDNVEVARGMGIDIKKSKICGGGAKSKLWKKIIANVLNIELQSVATEQGPGLGGAMLASVGCKEYSSVSQCVGEIVKIKESIKPNAELVKKYEDKYEKFKLIYPTLKNLFRKIR